ncbi:MAG: sugar transferase [Pisciglobus halotolerans]|nr:sugar transferase [Pisciglobus halotolerans]
MEEVDYNREVRGGSPSIWLSRKKLNHKHGYHFAARFIDIVGIVIGLILLSPLFVIVAFLIKKEEPEGTVFYSQTRVGKNSRKFRMYKFRSMCVDADTKLAELLQHNEVEGPMFKMKDDPRITRVGKFIRKTSIDELPQLWNVLKGEMSLVGPRPPLEREVKEYTDYDKQRLYVKPGCTGLWQISGRNKVGFHDMVDLDIQYINKIGVWNDMKIMLKTINVIFKSDGAY